MTTKNEYIAQAKSANPKPMFATINGEKIALTDEEYETAIENWAIMRVMQDTPPEE